MSAPNSTASAASRRCRERGASFRESRARLEAERIALVRLEAEHRARSQELDQSALVESDRALALGEQARDIVDQMETQGRGRRATGPTSLALPGPLPRPPQPGDRSPRDRASAAARPIGCPSPGHSSPALASSPPPASARRGITLATAPNADAIAPAAGTHRLCRGASATMARHRHHRSWQWLDLADHRARRAGGRGSAIRSRQGQLIGRAPGAGDPRRHDRAAPPRPADGPHAIARLTTASLGLPANAAILH